jgi:NhaA family Na+:H+ antiporter
MGLLRSWLRFRLQLDEYNIFQSYVSHLPDAAKTRVLSPGIATRSHRPYAVAPCERGKPMAIASKRSVFNHEAAPGAFLLVAACVSMALANSPLAADFAGVLKTEVGIRTDALTFVLPASSWIKDLLMAFFFFFVGLELKREFVDGEMSDLRRAALPLAGAAGGMIAPALIYLAFNLGSDHTLAGWGIPMATDIAFALGVLSLLGKRVPPRLKIFLLALAIIDDLGAIVVIAVFYGTGLHVAAFVGALICFAIGLALNRAGVTRLWPYALLAGPMWFAMHESGVHATVAGVLLALTIPYRIKATEGMAEPPLLVLEHNLREIVMFIIMPLFALANVGVSLAGVRASDFVTPVTLGIGLGLFIGKPLGIVLATLAAAKALKTPLPFSLASLVGVGWIAGIGFTMSLFIGALAFSDPQAVTQTRLGVFGGSLAAAFAGLGLLAFALQREVTTAEAAREAVKPFLVEDD